MKKNLKILITALTLTILITSCAPAQINNNDTLVRKMNVRGEGVIELEPQIARVHIGVRTQSNHVAEALSENNAIAAAIIQSLLDLGIQEREIQTRDFNVYPQHNARPAPEDEEIQTFVVENAIYVIVRDFDSLGQVLANAIAEGANTIHGISFDIENREKVVEKARQLAIEDAQSQAESTADAAGIELGPIHSISVDREGAPGPRPAVAMERAPGEDVPIAGGMLTIMVSVSITYKIN